MFDHRIDEEAKRITGGFYLGGMEMLNPEDLQFLAGHTLIPYLIADLFKAQRQKLISEGYDFPFNYNHVIRLV